MKLYKARPLTVEAMQYTGENWEELHDWLESFISTPIKYYLHPWDLEAGDFLVRSTESTILIMSQREFSSMYEELL